MDGKATALLAMDLQRDFLAPGGRLPIAADQQADVVDAMNAALAAAEARGWPIVYVLNAFRPWQPANLFRNFCALAGSPGAALDPRIAVVAKAERIEKRAPDAFTSPALGPLLARLNVGRLVIGGVFADACVSATARAALGKGYQVAILGEGVGAGSAKAREAALDRLRAAGAEILTGQV